MRMSPEVLRAVVESGGFQLNRLVDLPYHYGAVFRSVRRSPPNLRDAMEPFVYNR